MKKTVEQIRAELVDFMDSTEITQKAEYNIHENPPGISGWLIEGRTYYDAFVLNNKKDAIALLKKAAE